LFSHQSDYCALFNFHIVTNTIIPMALYYFVSHLLFSTVPPHSLIPLTCAHFDIEPIMALEKYIATHQMNPSLSASFSMYSLAEGSEVISEAEEINEVGESLIEHSRVWQGSASAGRQWTGLSIAQQKSHHSA
jgi:hypothetical protein